MVGWHHLLNGHVFEQAQGVGDEHGSQHATVCGVTKSRTQLNNRYLLRVEAFPEGGRTE